LPLTGVNPFRDFIRPAFRPNGIKAHKDFETRLPVESHAAKLYFGWADEASSGTHPGQATLKQIPEKSFSCRPRPGGGVGEALERRPLSNLGKKSRTLTKH